MQTVRSQGAGYNTSMDKFNAVGEIVPMVIILFDLNHAWISIIISDNGRINREQYTFKSYRRG